jgi:hypothetical protein
MAGTSSTNYVANFRALSLGAGNETLWLARGIGLSSTGTSSSPNTYLNSIGAGTLQHGQTDAAAPVAQTIGVQRVVAGTSNTAGALWTLKDSAGTGTGISGGVAFQVAPAGSTGTAQNTYSSAVTIAGGTGLFALPLITTDSAHTDATICEDTTTHALYSGSGTLGICLGTSGRQFKTDLVPMKAGLKEISGLDLWNYRYKNGWGDSGKRIQYGPTAQDVEKVLPDLVGRDDKGTPINYDSGALLLISLHAIQELKAEVDDLKHKLSTR